MKSATLLSVSPPLLAMKASGLLSSIISDSEILLDDARMLEQKMTAQGAYCALEIGHNLMHVYPIYVNLPEGKRAMDRVLSFMTRAVH